MNAITCSLSFGISTLQDSSPLALWKKYVYHYTPWNMTISYREYTKMSGRGYNHPRSWIHKKPSPYSTDIREHEIVLTSVSVFTISLAISKWFLWCGVSHVSRVNGPWITHLPPPLPNPIQHFARSFRGFLFAPRAFATFFLQVFFDTIFVK